MKKWILILILILVAAGGGVATSLLLAPKAHELVYYQAIEPTCETPGNVDYYYCKECNKYYDSSKNEVAKSKLILPALGHVYQFESFDWIDNNYDFCLVNLVCSNDPNHTTVEYVEIESQVTPATIKDVQITKYIATYGTHTDEKVVYGKQPIVPQFTFDNGFYDNAFNFEIYVDGQYDIYYTLDGSDPTTESTKYTSYLHASDNSSDPNTVAIRQNISALDVFYPTELLDKCMVVKAIAVDSEGNTSRVSQRIFFIGYKEKQGYDNLPIISLTVENNDLFDYEKGIYVTGQTYDADDYSSIDPEKRPANYNQQGEDWQRAAKLTYFDEMRNCTFAQDISVCIHNDLTNAQNQKSFDLFVSEEDEYFSLFGDNQTKSCTLRSGGYYDSSLTKLRDMLTQDLSKWENTFDVQQGYPCIVFLNGEYWGIYNIQENYTKDYISEKYEIDNDNIIIVKNDNIYDGEEEDLTTYSALREFFADNDFTEQEQYVLAGSYIDIEEFASYMAVELYVGNVDWPANNVVMWRSKTIGENTKEDAVWHFMLDNTSSSSAFRSDLCAANKDPFANASHLEYGPLDTNCVLGLIFSKLMQNGEFVYLFKQALMRVGTEIFDADIVNPYLNEKIELLQNNIEKHYARFVSEDATTYDKEYFLGQVELIRDFFEQRYVNILQFFENHFE